MTPVLLPGNMCDARLWTADVRAVLGRAADADLTQDDSIAAMAARALAATDGMLLPVGFSMGAIVAAEMARQSPDRIAGLVLAGFNANADLPERSAHRPVQQSEVRTGGLERVLTEELKPNYLAPESRDDAALLALLRDMGMVLGPDVFVRQSEALRLRGDLTHLLPVLATPVLYACGSADILCPPVWHSRWTEMTARARLCVFNGVGHMLPLEAPVAFADALKIWMIEQGLA